MIGATVKAALTNFNGTYLVLPPLVVITIVALLASASDASPSNLLMSIDFVTAASIGLFAGTTLAEIKVKPLSFVLPGQERSMAPAMLWVGTGVCLIGALLVLIRPMSVTEVPALQQALAALGFGLGLFMLVVAVCVVTRDTAYTSLLLVGFPPMLLIFAMINASFRPSFIAVNVALAEHPVLSVLFAALGIGAAFCVLGRRSLSRGLCGAPFLPLKAYDNPFKMDDFRRRMRSASFRPSVMTSSRGGPGGLALAALSRRLAGTSWDYLVLDTRVSRNEWEFALRLLYWILLIVLMTLVLRTAVPGSALPGNAFASLIILVVLTFVFFGPTFKPRVSPMLPVARRQHFRSFVSKGVSVYGSTILAMLLLQSAAGLLGGSTGLLFSTFAKIAALPFKGILVVAAAAPLLCWAFTKLRSTIGFLVFLIFFAGIGANLAAAAEQTLLGLSYTTVLVASALCWLPFLGIAWKRCFKDDLLLP